MHLVFITSPYRLGSGASERIVLELIRRFLKMGIEITVFQPGSNLKSYVTHEGISIYEYPSMSFTGKSLESILHYTKSWRYSMWFKRRVLNDVKRDDTLIITTRFHNVLFLTLNEKFIHQYPVIVYELNHYPWVEDMSYISRLALRRRVLSIVDRNLQLKIAKIVLGKATKVIAVSNTLKSWIQKELPDVSSKIEVIYNPVDTKLFTPDIDGEILRKKLQLEDKRILLHVGTDHLVYRKGLHYAIKCLAKLPKDVVLIVTGYRVVPYLNKSYWNYIKHLIDKYDLRNRVIFVGWVLYNQLPLYHNVSELLLYPSIQEGFGVPLIEAMASARPIVGFDIPPINELVENRKTGMLVPLGDVGKLSEAVRILLDDKNLWERMSINAREKALKEFSLDKIAEDHLKLYTKVLGRL
jgi:glycosyltransferase involved in cell wall biosynthesis